MNVLSEPPTLRGRDLVSVADLGADEVVRIFNRAVELKAEFLANRRHADPPLVGWTLAMLFHKPSLRTRVTFEAAMNQLCGHAIYLTEDVRMGARETFLRLASQPQTVLQAIVARTGSSGGFHVTSPPSIQFWA